MMFNKTPKVYFEEFHFAIKTKKLVVLQIHFGSTIVNYMLCNILFCYYFARYI